MADPNCLGQKVWNSHQHKSPIAIEGSGVTKTAKVKPIVNLLHLQICRSFHISNHKILPSNLLHEMLHIFLNNYYQNKVTIEENVGPTM